MWDRLGVTPVERFVELPMGNAVRVQELGEGPPVVFLHGGSIAGTSWSDLVARLGGVRSILIDRPGCGLSDPIPNGPLRSIGAVLGYADRLLGELLDALELDRATVAATSYGGLFAVRGAAAAADRVDRLIEYSWLIGAPAGSAPMTARLAAVPGMRSLMSHVPMTRGMVRSSLRQFGLRRAIDSGSFDDVMLDWAHSLLRDTGTLRNELRSSPRVVTPLKGHNTALLLPDELLSHLTMPALFIWGADDPNGGEEIARDFVPRVPYGRLLLVPGGEHAPWLDDLDLCVEATCDFLGTHPAR